MRRLVFWSIDKHRKRKINSPITGRRLHSSNFQSQYYFFTYSIFLKDVEWRCIIFMYYCIINIHICSWTSFSFDYKYNVFIISLYERTNRIIIILITYLCVTQRADMYPHWHALPLRQDTLSERIALTRAHTLLY